MYNGIKFQNASGNYASVSATNHLPTAGGGGGSAGPVGVSNFPRISGGNGPLTNAQLVAVSGTAAQVAVATDPAAAGLTQAALLRGILAGLLAQTAVLEAIRDKP